MPDPSLSREFTLVDVRALAERLLEVSAGERIWLFTGQPGAGKTTLIREVCASLGVNSEAVSSPTFSILNEYEGSDGPVYHLDLYRLERETELYDIGLDEYLDSGHHILIEWPEKLGNLKPSRYFSVCLEVTGPDSRKIEFGIHV